MHLNGIWSDATLLLAVAPLAYYVLASVAALRFFRRERARSLPPITPPVSVLKPVRGLDFGSYENFLSFCLQDYPDYELLFAVNDDKDPAVPLIQRLQREFPERRIRLFAGAERLGANRKINKLARLVREARNDILVISDGDVRVGPQYLHEVVAPFADRPLQPLQVLVITGFAVGSFAHGRKQPVTVFFDQHVCVAGAARCGARCWARW